MLALMNTDQGPTVVDDHALSADLGPHTEAVIRLELGGVCATDLEIVAGYLGFRGVMGHEWVGVVEDTVGVAPHLEGRRVVGDINCPCRQCPTCHSGRLTHCPNRTVLGIVGRDGAFAERFRLPVGNLHLVPDGVCAEAAVFVEPLAAACQVLEQVHTRPSDRVAVLGMGRLGLMCSSVLALTGATVVGIGRSERHLDRLPLGVQGARTGDFDARSEQGRFDLVVDCTGQPEGLSLATRLVRSRGTIVLKTTVHAQSPASPTPWVLDEVTLVGSRCGPFPPALRLLERGLVDPRPWVTARRPLVNAHQALELAAQPEHIKVLIEGPQGRAAEARKAPSLSKDGQETRQ